jgi:hypothetical protein
VPLVVIRRQLGHSNLGITSIHLQGIDNAEIIDAVHARPRACGPGQRLAAALRMTAAAFRAKMACAGRVVPA